MDVDPYSPREMVRFQVGDTVKEVTGIGPSAQVEITKIIAITSAGQCMTSNSRWYDRLTGKSTEGGPYRAIHLVGSKAEVSVP